MTTANEIQVFTETGRAVAQAQSRSALKGQPVKAVAAIEVDKSEAFPGEGTPGVGLEVFLEGDGLFFAAKGQGRFDLPGSVLTGVRHTTLIVGFHTSSKVAGAPDVVAIGVGPADEDVDVVEPGGGVVNGCDGLRLLVIRFGIPASLSASPWSRPACQGVTSLASCCARS